MYDCILVPLDGSPTAQRGFAEAQTLAKKLGAALRLLYVVDAQMLVTQVGAYVPIEGLLTDWQAAGEKLMAEAVAEARAAGLQADSVVRCEVGQRVSDAIRRPAGRQRGALRGGPARQRRDPAGSQGLRRAPDRDGHARPPRPAPHGAGQRCRAGAARKPGASAAGAQPGREGLIRPPPAAR